MNQEENEIIFNLENEKNDLFKSFPQTNNGTLLKKESLNKFNINPTTLKSEEYFDYKTKKIKLFNLYNQLLEFREKLVIKEKELNKKEKSLLEFENVLKSNEEILKNNIEQFDIYIKNKIKELKNQFNQIEQIQINKENYLKQKEEEILKFQNQSYNFKNNESNYMNDKKCINCNCDLCNEEEIIKPFIDNYLAESDSNDNNDYNNNEIHYKKISYNGRNGFYCKGCNKFFKNIHHQKNKSMNFTQDNIKFNHFKKNILDYNNRNNLHKRYISKINKTHDNSIDFKKLNYSCYCQGCEFCNS